MTTKAKPENVHRLALRKARLILKRRSPAAWRSAIDAIRDPSLRVRAACIVWWDYFGHRTVADRWPHLDDIVRPWKPHVEFEPRILEDALCRLGYHRDVARARSVVRTTMQRKISPTEKHTTGNRPERTTP